MTTQTSPKSRKTGAPLKTSVSQNSLTNPANLRPSTEVIKAPTTIKRTTCRDGSTLWSLVVARCPFCGGRHTHGGGSGERPLLGMRESHCLRDWGEYLLLDAQGGAA